MLVSRKYDSWYLHPSSKLDKHFKKCSREYKAIKMQKGTWPCPRLLISLSDRGEDRYKKSAMWGNSALHTK